MNCRFATQVDPGPSFRLAAAARGGVFLFFCHALHGVGAACFPHRFPEWIGHRIIIIYQYVSHHRALTIYHCFSRRSVYRGYSLSLCAWRRRSRVLAGQREETHFGDDRRETAAAHTRIQLRPMSKPCRRMPLAPFCRPVECARCQQPAADVLGRSCGTRSIFSETRAWSPGAARPPTA
jgi:hypothetical protein